MKVQSLSGKKYVLVIVDDFSRYTWTKNLRSKDETSGQIISFIKIIQVSLQLAVQSIHTDNGTKLKNNTLCSFYESYGITQTFSAARTPEQNGVVERRNRNLWKLCGPCLRKIVYPNFCGQKLLILYAILKTVL